MRLGAKKLRDFREQRLAPRRSTFVAAKIHYNGNIADCVIRNISDTGAKLELGGVGKIPNTMKLVVDGHQPHTCRVVWRTIREMGVQFMDGRGEQIA